MKKVRRWLYRIIPICRGKMLDRIRELEINHEKAMGRMLKRHNEEIREVTKAASKIIQRCSAIEFQMDSSDGPYVVSVFLSPRLMWGMSDEIEFIARDIGKQVEMRIASSRFVQSPKDVAND